MPHKWRDFRRLRGPAAVLTAMTETVIAGTGGRRYDGRRKTRERVEMSREGAMAKDDGRRRGSRRGSAGALVVAAGFATVLLAGSPGAAAESARKPFQAQSASTIAYSKTADGEEVVEITNVSYSVNGDSVPGRPKDERLVLRKTVRTKEFVGDVGIEATVSLEAWPLGTELDGKPLYTIALSGVDGRVIDGDLYVFDRGTEEVDWWSVYMIGTGRHLFDTYVPLLSFSMRRDVQTLRYAGLEVPPDDAADQRLTEPHVVGVLSYASTERVLREALLTCDDPKRAELLRSYSDETRTLSLVETPAASKKKDAEPSRSLKLAISQNYPSPPDTVTALIPLGVNDLDLAHAKLPPCLHATAWRR